MLNNTNVDSLIYIVFSNNRSKSNSLQIYTLSNSYAMQKWHKNANLTIDT